MGRNGLVRVLVLVQALAWPAPSPSAEVAFDSFWELEFKLGNVREALARSLQQPKPWLPEAEEKIARYRQLIAELEAARRQFPPHIARQYYAQQQEAFQQLRDDARELLKGTKPNTRERWIWEHKLELAEERLRYLEGNEPLRGAGPAAPGLSTQSTGAAPPKGTGTPRAAPAPRLSEGVRRLLSSEEGRRLLERISENKGAVAANLLVAAVQVVVCRQNGGGLAACLAESTAEQAAAATAAWLTGSAAGSAIPAAVLLTYHLDAEMVRSGQSALQNVRIVRAIQAQQQINLRDPRLGERLERLRAEIDKLVKLGEDIRAEAADLRATAGAVDVPELEKRLAFLRRSAPAFARFQTQCRQARDSRDQVEACRQLAARFESRMKEYLGEATRTAVACAYPSAANAAAASWNAALASQRDLAEVRDRAVAANDEVVKSQGIVASAREQLRQVRALAEGFNTVYAPTQAGTGYQRVAEKLQQFDRDRFYITSALELIALPKEEDKTYAALREVLLDLRVRSLEPRPLTAEEEANLNPDRRVKPEDLRTARPIKEEHDRLLDQFAAAVAPCDAARPAHDTVAEIASLADRAAQLWRSSDPSARIAACRLRHSGKAPSRESTTEATLTRPAPASAQPEPPKSQPPKPGELPALSSPPPTPPAREEFHSGAGLQGPDGEMVGTCRATIRPSRREGYAGDTSEITVTILPPWDQKIVEVNLLVLPAGRELSGVKRIGPGRFTRQVRFAGQSGPITLLFVARDAKRDVYCQGTLQLTSKGPAAK